MMNNDKKRKKALILISSIIAIVAAAVAVIFAKIGISVGYDSLKTNWIVMASSLAASILVLLSCMLQGRVKASGFLFKMLLAIGFVCLVIAADRFCKPFLDKMNPFVRIIFPALAVAATHIWHSEGRRRAVEDVSSASVRRSAADGGASRYALSTLSGSLVAACLVSVYYILADASAVFLLAPCACALVFLLLWVFVRRGWPLLLSCTVFLFAACAVLFGMIATGLGEVGEAVVAAVLFESVRTSLVDVYICVK